MRKTLILSLLLLVSLSALAQAPPATSGSTHFSVDASAVGFSGSGSATAATIAGGTVSLTARVAVGYEQVIAPSLSATYYLGTANYTIPFASLVGKKLNSHFVFDTSKWSVTFTGGAGVIRQDLTGAMTQNFATTAGTGLNYVADNHVTIQVISGQWLHALVAGQAANQFIVTPNTAAIASGLKLTF